MGVEVGSVWLATLIVDCWTDINLVLFSRKTRRLLSTNVLNLKTLGNE